MMLGLRRRLFPSAREDAVSAERNPPSPQTLSPTYRLAFRDHDFLLRDDLRPVRLQLELLKPELAFQEAGIEATIVVFGSSRIPDAEAAAAMLAQAEERAQAAPEDEAAAAALRIARSVADKVPYYDEGRRFGRLASEAFGGEDSGRCVIVTGGGPGLMEAANRGADDVGAPSVGLNIVLPHEQEPNRYITPELSFQFHYFALRKMHFLMRARALVVLPGGFGTMDELFETLTLIQTGKVAPMPVLLFGKAYWDRIVNFDAMVEEGVIAPQDRALLRFVETAEEAVEAIRVFLAEEKRP